MPHAPHPYIAIVDANTLAAIGLQQMLQNVMPAMAIETYGSFNFSLRSPTVSSTISWLWTSSLSKTHGSPNTDGRPLCSPPTMQHSTTTTPSAPTNPNQHLFASCSPSCSTAMPVDVTCRPSLPHQPTAIIRQHPTPNLSPTVRWRS